MGRLARLNAARKLEEAAVSTTETAVLDEAPAIAAPDPEPNHVDEAEAKPAESEGAKPPEEQYVKFVFVEYGRADGALLENLAAEVPAVTALQMLAVAGYLEWAAKTMLSMDSMQRMQKMQQEAQARAALLEQLRQQGGLHGARS